MENNTPVYKIETGQAPSLPRKYRRGMKERYPGCWVNPKTQRALIWDAGSGHWVECEHVLAMKADSPEEAERLARVGAEVVQMRAKGFFN